MDNLGTSNKFIKGNDVEWKTVGEGIQRQILGYDDKILLSKIKFEKGSIGTMHKHFHSQVTYVVSGKFQLTINGETRILEGGDSFYIPPNTMHGSVCEEEGVFIDVFSPIRKDFIE